jgi:hypothetical protein
MHKKVRLLCKNYRKEVDKMKESILAIVMGVLTFVGTIFICILSANKNEIWEKIRERM